MLFNGEAQRSVFLVVWLNTRRTLCFIRVSLRYSITHVQIFSCYLGFALRAFVLLWNLRWIHFPGMRKMFLLRAVLMAKASFITWVVADFNLHFTFATWCIYGHICFNYYLCLTIWSNCIHIFELHLLLFSICIILPLADM